MFIYLFFNFYLIIREIVKLEEEIEAMQDELKGSEKRKSMLYTDLQRFTVEREQLIEELNKNEQNIAILDNEKVLSENELEEVRRNIEKIKGMFLIM